MARTKTDKQSPPRSSWRESMQLPKTEFAMKAQLNQQEPKWQAHWQTIGLYDQLRAQSQGRPKFILHDGPPYANGDIHTGHAINKILKDIIVRSQQMQGKDAPYVPGWDCHGLPIEWKIEEEYRHQKKQKDDVPVLEFRAHCRDFASKWMARQSTQFQRLGVLGDFAAPYSTMAYVSEAAIMAQLHQLVMAGRIYRGVKPVMWSVVEQTALADAEIEYLTHNSPQIYAGFPIPQNASGEVRALIWTTTPWTIPANKAIAYHPDLSYGLYDSPKGQVILADSRAQAVAQHCEIDLTRLGDVVMKELGPAQHPLHGLGYTHDVPFLPAMFVSGEEGTGLVHIAPAHGSDDFALGRAHQLSIAPTLDDAGCYLPSMPHFAGRTVVTSEGKMGDANPTILQALSRAQALFAQSRLTHNYPHSWRSKAPVIFRLTPQWFISMEEGDLRKKSLQSLDKVHFVPEAGRARLTAMMATRPDWVISRQRLWGVPLGVFVHKTTGDILKDEAVNARILAAVNAGGADAWFATPAGEFLGSDYDPQDWEKIEDILDVWFDSGATHAFALKTRPELAFPADVYLEGSDQHRGWFQSSLLVAQANSDTAPYKQLVTHGFLLAQDGNKASKSNEKQMKQFRKLMDPLSIVQERGADVLRLWVANSDYTEDVRLSDDSLQTAQDAYRQMRNGLRFLLGNLHACTQAQLIARHDWHSMPELERYLLHRLYEVDSVIRRAYNAFALRRVWQSLFQLMVQDLSNFYFDIRKDTLYCDALEDPRRRACCTLIYQLLECLITWLAPILPHTTEEAWALRPLLDDSKDIASVHLRDFPDIPASWQDEALAKKWRYLRSLRRVVMGALEQARQAGKIGAGLEAAPVVYVDDAALYDMAQAGQLAELCITSQLSLQNAKPPAEAFCLPELANVGVIFAPAKGIKCGRCWKFLPEVQTHPDAICQRCARVIQAVAPSSI